MRVILIFLFAAQAYSETFLGPSSPTNRLEVKTGEVLIFRTWDSTSPITARNYWKVGDQEFELFNISPTIAKVLEASLLAGPGELVFNKPMLVTFDRIKADNVTTFHTGKSKHTFVIPPDGRLIVWAAVPDFGGTGRFTFSNPSGQNVEGVIQFKNDTTVFDGPGTLVILSQNPGFEKYGALLTVTQSSRNAVMTHGLVPSQGSTLMLMESTDLKSWTPAGLISGRADPSKYYRIVGGR